MVSPPPARQSLHMEGKAADIRIANLNEEVLGGLVRSFRQGGVGFYYRAGPRGGSTIHPFTEMKKTSAITLTLLATAAMAA